MRELTIDEMEQVDGGIGFYGAAMGAAAGAVSAALNGGGVAEMATGAMFGAASGFFGGIGGATVGVTRAMFSSYSLGTGAIGTRAVYEMTEQRKYRYNPS